MHIHIAVRVITSQQKAHGVPQVHYMLQQHALMENPVRWLHWHSARVSMGQASAGTVDGTEDHTAGHCGRYCASLQSFVV